MKLKNLNLGLLLGLLCIILLIRLTCWPTGLIGGDAFGYAIGGLGTWASHSPGFFGYCLIGWSVNQFVGNIIDSYALINIASTLAGTLLCYGLARAFDLSTRQSLLAAAVYGLSLNVLYFGNTGVSYAPEGMLATAVALCGQLACRKKSSGWAFATTLLWAIAGALRQTTTAFLAPLYGYVLWRSGQRVSCIAHLIVAGLIIFGWTKANNHYLAATGGKAEGTAGNEFWALQVMMPSAYNPTVLGAEEKTDTGSSSQYHWPFVEVLYIADEAFGTKVLPDYRDFGAPPPSIEHSLRLCLMQLLKLGFYTLVSAPSLLMLAPVLFRRRPRLPLVAGNKWFLAAWLVPPLSFFVVGHLGSFGYLQLVLPGLAVLAAAALHSPHLPDAWRLRPSSMEWLFIALTAIGPVFFLVAKPYKSAEQKEKLADVLLLQYTADGIRERYFVSRAWTMEPGPAQLPEWRLFEKDQQLVDYVKQQGYLKSALYPISAPKP